MKVIYNVEKFDTLQKIAEKFSVSAEKIKQLNNISNELPKVIEIPNNSVDFEVVANLNREFLFKGDYNLVKNSLSKLGFHSKNSYGDVHLFKKTKSNIYVVGVLDNLNAICNKFKLDKNDVIAKNNLKSEKLFIGQILKI